QHQIQHDGVVVDGIGLIPRAGTLVQHVHAVAFLLQAGLDEAGNLSIVLDDQDSHMSAREHHCHGVAPRHVHSATTNSGRTTLSAVHACTYRARPHGTTSYLHAVPEDAATPAPEN